jgi:hypothetical protein
MASRQNPLQNVQSESTLTFMDAHERSPETLALLQILAIGEEQVLSGKIYPLSDVSEMLRKRLLGANQSDNSRYSATPSGNRPD